jgi:hypothetical protein
MAFVAGDTVGGFNQFIEDQKKLPGEVTVSLIQFDDEYQSIYTACPLSKVAKLVFAPRGNTALLDAIARAVNETGARLRMLPEAERPTQVLFVIITDGYENASREFKKSSVMEMLRHQQDKYNWQVVYLGANQDAIAEAGGLGIQRGQAMTYAIGPIGTRTMFANLSESTALYRASAQPRMEGFITEEQRKAQDELLKKKSEVA